MKAGKKNIINRIGGFLNRYLSCTKGAVSLLLVLVMSPLLSVSLLLVESARYQDAVQLMEEVMDTSAFSTLAEYDSYLEQRFGLLSISQDTNINTSFNNYLNSNVSALGNSITINSSVASGRYPLSNVSILKQQLLEYSEIMVAAEVVTEGIDIDELLKKLEKALDLTDLKKEVDAVNSGVELASEIEKLLEGITDAKKQYNDKFAPALSEYRSAYSDFESKASVLVVELNSAENNLEEGQEYELIYDEKAVKDAISDLKKSGKTYKDATSTLKTEYSTLKECIDTVISAIDSLPSKLQDFDDKTSESSLANDCTTSTYEWLNIVADQITTTFKSTVGADFKDKSTTEIQALSDQIAKLDQLSDKTITSSWDIAKVKMEYGTISISVSNSFSTKMDSLISLLNEEAAVDDTGSVQMANLLDIVGELLGIAGLYDANLNSVVGTSYLYNSTSMSLSAQLSMQSLTDLISACEDFSDGITSLNIIKAVKALGKLLKAVAEFLVAIIAWVAETLVNLVVYIASGPTEWYNGLLLYGYGAYNTPNRTTYLEGKTLSGFSYSKIYELAGGINRDATITGSLSQLSTIGNATGADKLFKGAETEYLLVGSTSELQNQSVAFFDLYLLRLVLDIIPVFKNKEVTAISAAAGPGAWVVKLAIALAEPMLDTIILVNGGKEYLFKDTVYLSYSGMVILQKDLVGITSISKNLQTKLKDTITAHNGEPPEKGTCDASYTEHMLILLMLSVNQTTYMQRMQNLIQMEGASKTTGFKLNEAYTYIYSDVKYTLNPMFNIDALTDNGFLTKTSRQYCGY